MIIKMSSDETLLELVYHGREERNLEYKRSMNWKEPATKAKIAKSAMAMANLPDGGVIVVGVEKKGEFHKPLGMIQEDIESFKQDDVMQYINEKYADPYIELSMRLVGKDNNYFVVIQINEFAELPIICKRDGLENLKKGALYTRSRMKYETVQVRSQTEMREIINLAVDKEIRRLHSRGLLQSSYSSSRDDKQAFEKQREGL